jgi:lysozyme
MSYLDIVRSQLRIDENVVNRPYDDGTGKVLVKGAVIVGKVTIGVGRNLTDVGVNDDEIALMERNDIAEAERTARKLVSNFDALNDARKAVILNMAFNMGLPVLAQFKNTLRAVVEGRWDDAADGMLASRWAKQTGDRATRLARAMRGRK